MAVNFGFNANEVVSLLMSLLTTKTHCPTEFHECATAVRDMLEKDTSGLLDSLTDFQVDSSTVRIKIETGNENLDKILNEDWLDRLNIQFRGQGIQTGLEGLMKEYYRERWKGASFPLFKIVNKWEEIGGLMLPTSIVIADGGSIYCQKSNNDNGNSLSLLDYKYFLGKSMKEEINGNNYFMYKVGTRWFKKYPTPYLIRRGAYKHWQIIDTLKNKQMETLKQLIPYFLLIKEGSEALELNKDKTASAPELLEIKKQIQELIDRVNKNQENTPVRATNWDEIINHLIPDIRALFDTNLVASAEKGILAGLGFIDIAEGVSASIDKKEFVLIKHNNKIKQLRVNEVESLKGKIEVPTFEKGSMVWKSAKLWKHLYNGKMYNVISDDGRMRVRTTGNHSIMVWDKERGLTSKRADELRNGDFILTLKNLNLKDGGYKNLIYYDYFGSNQNSIIKKPIKVKVDEDFAYFLGWWMAEGSCSKYAIHLSVGTDKEEAEKVLKIGEKVFNKQGYLYSIRYKNPKYKTLYEVRFNSKGISALFKENCNTGARHKKVPEVIFNSSKKIQESFLKGLLEGDGYYNKKKQSWELTTASEELAYGVITLARMVGRIPHLNVQIRPFISKNFEERRTYYKVYFAKQEGILKGLLPKLKTIRQGYVTNLEQFDDALNTLPKDWIIKRVQKIEIYDYNDMVYDLEVKDNPTFIAGTNVLVHNSRRESVLNPKPFIKECNAGLGDFKLFLRDLITLVKEKNKDTGDVNHPKYVNIKWIIVSDPITEFATQEFLELIRSENDRGNISNETLDSIISVNYEVERIRREREFLQNDDVLMSPRKIINTERDTLYEEERQELLNKETPEEETQDNLPEDKKGLEKENYNQATTLSKEELVLTGAPYSKVTDLPDAVKKLSPSKQRIFMRAFNYAWKKFANLPPKKRESRCFQYAWGVIKKIRKVAMTKATIEKIEGTIDSDLLAVIEEENDIVRETELEVLNKKNKLLDYLLGNATNQE